MNTKILLNSAGALATSALLFAASAATESIETSTKNMFKALDAGDRVTVHAYGPTHDMHFPVQAFDYDWDNKPVAMVGVEAVRKYVDSLFDEMARRKMKVASVVSNLRTGSSSPELGFAVFDLTQTMTLDGKSETSKFRITTLLNYDQKTNKWRQFHWHATLVPTVTPPAK